MRESRNSVEDVWGPRTPYYKDWPVRVDEQTSWETSRRLTGAAP